MATLSTVISYGEPTGTIVTEIGTPGPTGQTGPQGPAGPTFTGGDIAGPVTMHDGTNDSEMSAAFFGVELSSDTTQYAELQYNSLTIGNAGSNTQITPAGVTFPDSTVQSTGFPGSSAFYPSTGNPSGFLTAASLSGYATQSWVTSQGYATQSYVNGQGFITSSALTPYLRSSTAAATYQTISGMSAYLSKAGNLSGLSNTATARTNLGLGTMATQTASNYLTVSAAAAGYYPLTGNPSGFITSSALTGYATESWVTAGFYPLTGNPSAFLTDAPSDGSQYARQDGAWSVVTGGGGGSYLPLAGGTMTGPIVFDGTSGQYISKGNFDTSRGGNYGISLVCSIGYEFNWQAGWLTTTNQGNTTPRPLYLDSLAGTTLRSWSSATDTGVEVAHTGITFPDSSVQTKAAFVPGSGNLDMTGYDITNANFNSSAGQVSAQNVSLSSGGSITFGDATVQTTASTVGEAPQDGQMYARVDGIWLPIPGTPTYTLIATGYTSIAGWIFSGTNIYLGSNGKVIADTPGSANGNGSNFTINGSDTAGATLDLSSFTGITNPIQLLNISSSNAPILPSSLAISGVGINGYAPANLPSAIFGYSSISNLNISNANNITSIPSLSGLTSLSAVNVYSNALMTSAPDFTGCTSLSTVNVFDNTSMTSAPSFSGCTALSVAQVYSNTSMASAPDFTGCTALNSADVHDNASMTSAPSFSGCTALYTAYVFGNAAMTSAPDFSGCTSLAYPYVYSNAAMTSAPDFSGLTSLANAQVYSNTAMTSAPDFSGCTLLNSADVHDNASMTSAPSFSGCTALYTAYVFGNAAMTSAPDFSGLTSLTSAQVYNNASMTSAPNFSGLTSLNTANVSGCAITNCTDILDQLDANGLSGGYCDISGGTNQSIDPAYTSLTNLQSKGWTVVFNSL